MNIVESKQETLLSAMRATLKARGFKKHGKAFLRVSNDVVHIIALQSGSSSASESARVTINVAVWCKRLADAGTEPSVLSSHWRCRIGDLMPAKSEGWWSLSGRGTTIAVQDEIITAMSEYALTALARLPDSAALLSLWESGTYPGLTREQATRFADIAHRDARHLP